jgi:hypothetical protein
LSARSTGQERASGRDAGSHGTDPAHAGSNRDGPELAQKPVTSQFSEAAVEKPVEIPVESARIA